MTFKPNTWKYYLFHFSQENSIEVVSGKWLIGKWSCWYPTLFATSKSRHKALKEHMHPNMSENTLWVNYVGRVLGSDDGYGKNNTVRQNFNFFLPCSCKDR